MNYMLIIACLVIASICTVGVFSHRFNDTFLQRIALSGTVLSSLGIALQLYKCQYIPDSVNIFLFSIALWCCATFLKYR